MAMTQAQPIATGKVCETTAELKEAVNRLVRECQASLRQLATK